MSGEGMVKMTIKFVDGSQESYSFERQMTEEDKYTLASQLQERIDATSLAVDLGSKLLILPVNNIQRIELEPPPAKLPPHCIQGASQG
ncbi:MAG: hypothetical protein ABFS19_07150 [Thermodesulfobacteriota bacterium]